MSQQFLPCIRWAGSKRSVLQRLHDMIPSEFDRYVEPFCGSACLFFRIDVNSAILSDLNPELINAYRMIRRDVDGVVDSLSRMSESKVEYYRLRGLNPAMLSDFDRATRFLYLNHFCFNGIYRTNKMGLFNVPFSEDRLNTPIPFDRIRLASKKLQNASIRQSDFEDVVNLAEPNDFYYLDPPYALQNRRIFVDYGSDTFSFSDVARLVNAMRHLDAVGAYFLVSYAYSNEVLGYFSEWNIKKIRLRRHISGFASGRRHAYEICVTNYTNGN